MSDLLANGQPGTGPFELVLSVKPAEELENSIVMARVDADAVVTDEKSVRIGAGGRAWAVFALTVDDADLDPGMGTSVVLNAVADEIGKQLLDSPVVTPEKHARANEPDFGPAAANQLAEVSSDLGGEVCQIDRGELSGDLARPGQDHEPADHRPHALGGRHEPVHVLMALGIKLLRVILKKEIRERTQRSKRLLKIVRDDVDEFIELPVLG